MGEPINVAICSAQQRFESVSDSAKLDAELLLAACLQKPRSYLYSWPERNLSNKIWQNFERLIRLRLKPTPVAYLLGYREFYSLRFRTSPVALIPRPETELLVETALQFCIDNSRPRVLEMGTGTGAISVALLKERADIDLVTTDISTECLQLARENAWAHGVMLNCIESNWYDNLSAQSPFDLIVSNPPYVAATDLCLRQGDLLAEPLLALTPGQTGLEAIVQIIAGASALLKSGGYLLLEHGHFQAIVVTESLMLAGFETVRTIFDTCHQPRVTFGQKP